MNNQGVIIGTIVDGGEEKDVLLQREDRRRHLYIIGKTGVGKSTLIENLVQNQQR